MTKQCLISFVGIIGSGKTTIINKINSILSARGYPVISVVERVEKWTSEYNMLPAIENNTNEKSLAQADIFYWFQEALRETKDFNGIVIMERSVQNAIKEFCSDITSELALHVFNHFTEEERSRGIDLIVNLNTNIEDCLESIRIRNRPGELVNMNYQEKYNYLHLLHENHINYLESVDEERVFNVDRYNYNNCVLELVDRIIEIYNSKNKIIR